MDSEQSNTIAEIDVTLLKELLEAGNELARLVDLEWKAERVDDVGALERWETAVGKAVLNAA